jgi:type II secretory pathway component PulF
MNQRNALFTIAAASTILLSVIAVLAFYAVPIFQTLFENFEAEIPANTQLVISSYKYWIIFAFIPLVIAVKAYKNKEMTKTFSKYAGWLSIAAFVFAWLLLAFTVSAMYEPIYGLSSHNQ